MRTHRIFLLTTLAAAVMGAGIAVVVGAALTGSGLQEARWGAAKVPSSQTALLLGVHPDYCWVEDGSPVEDVEIRERDVTITITVYVEPTDSEEDCLSYFEERVHLNRPLGNRRLIDGSSGREVELEPCPSDGRCQPGG